VTLITFDAVGSVYLVIKYATVYLTAEMAKMNATAVCSCDDF